MSTTTRIQDDHHRDGGSGGNDGIQVEAIAKQTPSTTLGLRFDDERLGTLDVTPTTTTTTNVGKHGSSLLDTRISDRPADYEPPASLRGPPPPDLLFGRPSYEQSHAHSHPHLHPHGMDNEAGPSHRAKQRRISLAEFRKKEGPAIRSAKLQAFWTSLPDRLPAPSRGPTPTSLMHLPGQGTIGTLSPERVERLRRLYEEELSRRISLEERAHAELWGGADDLPEPATAVINHRDHNVNNPMGMMAVGKVIKWKDFRKFLWDQEEQLWDIFCDLDRDGDGLLDHHELKDALGRSGER
jgi:hypothetical protein